MIVRIEWPRRAFEIDVEVTDTHDLTIRIDAKGVVSEILEVPKREKK